MAKKIIVRAYDGEVERFQGEDIIATVRERWVLYVHEKDALDDEVLGIFNRWEYVREVEE